jgi:hypothetical protein
MILGQSIINTEPLPIVPSMQNTVETDVASRRQMKRLRKSLDQQMKSANIRSLKSHGAQCKHMFDCEDHKCFKREPDKIVGEPYEVKR